MLHRIWFVAVKADSTLRSSRAVPHPSTNRALRRLTSEFRRDPVHSTRYGRQHDLLAPATRTFKVMDSNEKAICRLHGLLGRRSLD